MGPNPLIVTNPYDPWCNTCGKDIPMGVWNENEGECDECLEWWRNNSPPEENSS